MIRHIIFLKLKEHAEGKSKAENAQLLKRELQSLVTKIPTIRRLEVGININPEPDALDLALISEFATKDDLDSYLNHPEHLRVGAVVKRLRESRSVVDYEF